MKKKKNIILGVTIITMVFMAFGCVDVGSNKIEGKWEGKKTIANNEFTGVNDMGGDAVFKETYSFTGNQFTDDFEIEMEIINQADKDTFGEDALVLIVIMKGTITGEYSYDEKSKKLSMIPSTCHVLSQDFDYKGPWLSATKENAANWFKGLVKKEDLEKAILKNSQIFDVLSITSDMMSLKDDDGITYTYKSVK